MLPCYRQALNHNRDAPVSLENELVNLSLANGVQEVLYLVRLSIGQVWMQRQPFLEVLFGTEEVVDSSTAAQEDSRSRRLEFLDPGVFENQMDSRTAVLTRIVYRYRLVFQFAADQQHEINRSKDLEGFLSFYLNAVVHEGDAHSPFPVHVSVLRHAIAETLDRRIGSHDSEAL